MIEFRWRATGDNGKLYGVCFLADPEHLDSAGMEKGKQYMMEMLQAHYRKKVQALAKEGVTLGAPEYFTRGVKGT